MHNDPPYIRREENNITEEICLYHATILGQNYLARLIEVFNL